MRIAYVTETYPPELNGVSLTVERTVTFLRERGHCVQLIRPRQPGEAACDDDSEWRTAGCRIPMYPDLRFGLARRAALRLRLVKSGARLVHLATPGPLAWAALAAARSLGLAVTSDFRTNFHQYSRYYGLGVLAPIVLSGLRRFHNRTAHTFVPTREALVDLSARGFENLSVVGRGVDTARFTPARRSAALRAKWSGAPAESDAPRRSPVLLCVGRIAAEKNVGLALRAFESARLIDAGVQLVVVGDGPMRERLEAAHPAARFVGVQRGDALAAHYASADVFLFPSLSDTFGNVTIEALASGLPVISFDVAAAGEHVVDGQSGLLVMPGDDDAFVAAVCSIATDPSRLPAMSLAAVAAAREARWPDVLAHFERQLAGAMATAEETSRHATAVA